MARRSCLVSVGRFLVVTQRAHGALYHSDGRARRGRNCSSTNARAWQPSSHSLALACSSQRDSQPAQPHLRGRRPSLKSSRSPDSSHRERHPWRMWGPGGGLARRRLALLLGKPFGPCAVRRFNQQQPTLRPRASRSGGLTPTGQTLSATAEKGSTKAENDTTFADFLPVIPPECLKVKPPAMVLQAAKPGPSSFTEMFRMMSPYINFHRGSTMVIHIPGQVLESNVFSAVMHDIALLNTFGIKLVLVAGSRPQLNRQLEMRQLSQRFDCGVRITGPEELKCAMDAAGSVRFQIESYLGRGIVNSPGRARSINISSGNFITAQPVGVRGGVDFKHTGEVRRLNTNKVRDALDDGDIVLISSIGYSASGEVFNCMSEQVASKCAIQLESDKLIFLHDGEEMFDSRTNQTVQALVIQQAQQYVEIAQADPDVGQDFLLYLKESIKACVNGVTRSHLVSRHVDGGLLEELFTRDGEGLMISKHMYEGVRMAKTTDIVSIMRLIQPLLDEDILVSRNQEQIESNVHTFSVVERDGAIIACAALQPYENNYAEMACVAVDPTYRSLGKGNALLGYILRKARSMGVNRVFVLTTRTAHWFLERGFEPATVEDLPPSKRAKIDLKRQSKVYMMDISCKRALDEKELLLQMS